MQEVVTCLVPDSTPGVPLAAVAASNKRLVDLMGVDSLASLIYDRINLLVVCGRLDPDQVPEDLVEKELTDPVRLFVKNEPHKRSKIVDGRLRLIASVGSLDSLVERVLYAIRNGRMIDAWDSIPPKPGMGSSDEDLEKLAENLRRMLERGELIDSDVSGWDWRRKKWMAFARIYVHALWFNYGPDTDAFKALWNREVAATNPVFVLSDGRMLTLTVNGIQLSGRYITSSSNSDERILLSSCAGTHAIAMGDDCVETSNGWKLSTIKRRYASMQYSEDKGEIEFKVTKTVEETIFCSLRFYTKQFGQELKWVAEPVNWFRTLFRYVTKGKGKLSYADFNQFADEIRHLRLEDGQKEKLLLSALEYVAALPQEDAAAPQ